MNERWKRKVKNKNENNNPIVPGVEKRISGSDILEILEWKR